VRSEVDFANSPSSILEEDYL